MVRKKTITLLPQTLVKCNVTTSQYGGPYFYSKRSIFRNLKVCTFLFQEMKECQLVSNYNPNDVAMCRNECHDVGRFYAFRENSREIAAR